MVAQGPESFGGGVEGTRRFDRVSRGKIPMFLEKSRLLRLLIIGNQSGKANRVASCFDPLDISGFHFSVHHPLRLLLYLLKEPRQRGAKPYQESREADAFSNSHAM